jgi:5-bromo-4-chloroindolyl phosphate hydrolysis protein
MPHSSIDQKPSWWRVLLTQLLLLHTGTYVVVMVGLFLINLMTGITQPWFLFPLFGWGLVVAVHALIIYLLLNVRIARTIAATSQKRSDPAYVPRRGMSEIDALLAEGSAVLRQMRSDVRSIPSARARNQAFATYEASEQVLLAIREHPDELPLARDFVHRFLQPAGTLIGDYARLARREVPSAQAMLREVERKDLPRLTERANAMFDRVHRGTIIDLAVAREMMALDVSPHDELAETSPLSAPA